ncbi:MAG TPA: maleylpyruvate isomerase family mycothiol-dependent enzyme [Nocardioides sp.]
MELSEHLEGLRAALVAFVRYADRAGLDAPVPTTPDWTVRQLIAHQGMVHRWAAANVRGAECDPDALERQGLAVADPVEWLRDGAIEVVQAISEAPEDLEALVFLNDAPPARKFWARRQCHETTIHAVDALSAALGRYPTAADTWVDPALALDGIDELLAGFVTRPRARLRSDEPVRIAVLPDDAPTDAQRGWLVHVCTEPAVTERLTGSEAVEQARKADVVLEGGAVALYLTLWNRSDEAVPADGWDLWADRVQVRWS